MPSPSEMGTRREHVSCTEVETGAPRSGWLAGLLVGVLIGLFTLPTVRNTLLAQLHFALADENVPFVRALDARRNASEIKLLNATAAAAPGDYLLQVGRATALFSPGNGRSMPLPTPPSDSSLPEQEASDPTLYRLATVARDFPRAPGAGAHIARYLMVDRVRIRRIELEAPSPMLSSSAAPLPSVRSLSGLTADLPGMATNETLHTVRPRRQDLRLMLWALQRGERRDKDNAFWPAMLATTYFAAEQDDLALAALSRAARKRLWEAYLYEEVLGQWRLYSGAYGDNGASQKIGPLSLVAFPHLRELRRMAQLARRRAEEAEVRHHDLEAIHIRLNLALLGVLIRDTAKWAYEALVGTELCVIAATDGSAGTASLSIRNARQLEANSSRFHALLQRTHRVIDAAWIKEVVESSLNLRQQLDVARTDASFPGIPPGIPLSQLFGDWMAGICLLLQILSLVGMHLLAKLMFRSNQSRQGFDRLPSYLPALLGCLVVTSGMILFYAVPNAKVALIFLSATVACVILGAEHLFQKSAGGKAGTAHKQSGIQGVRRIEECWTGGTTVRMLLLLLVPGLALLYLLRPFLSTLHPVAVLFTSLMDLSHAPSAGETLEMAFLAAALPLALALVSSLWAFYRKCSPLAGALTGLRRVSSPAIACLAMAYLILLGRTLTLDATASRAISEAARNDIQWVLAHSDNDIVP